MAQDLLPLTGGEMSAKRTLDAISPSLAHFLTIDCTDANDAVLRVERRPEMLAEVRATNDLVQRLAAPAGIHGALRAMAPLMLMFDRPSFGKGDAGDKLADAWQTTYAQAIAHLPLEALEAAVTQWIQVGKFFPRAAELIALANPKAVEIRKIAWRMSQVVAKARIPRPPMTDAERAEMRRQTEELLGNLRSKASLARRGPNPSQAQKHRVADEYRAMA